MSETITATGATCVGGGHVRVWAGGPEAKPKVCACGNYRFIECHCTCGDVHERMVMIDPINEPIRREWDTPEEDEAWKNL